MQYQWKEGYHYPKGVKEPGVVMESLEGNEPTPQNLLELSRSDNHPLHAHLWDDNDELWAERGRLNECRKILQSIVTPQIVGERTIEVRAVEFLRVNGEGHWRDIETIRGNESLRAAYLREIQGLQEQALGKLAKYQELMESEE